MNIFRMLPLFFLLTNILPASAQNHLQLASFDGTIKFSFKLTKKAPVYKIIYKGKTIIDDSELSLAFIGEDGFWTSLQLLKPIFKEVDEYCDLVVGKVKTARNQYREVSIPLIEKGGKKRRINFVVRAFNDGLAFRYEFPEQENWSSYILTNETSTFNVYGNPTVHALLWNNYNNTHEGFYQKNKLSELKTGDLMDLPALFEFPEKVYMAITEANLRNYAGMYLTKNNGILTSQLSPLQGQTEIKVKASLPHSTPWRVMMISDRVGALLESNILTNLNDPAQTKDWSWLKPGKTSFHWWNGDIIPDTTFAPGANFETNKYYIDFCARNGLAYHSVIGYGGFAWYQSDAPNYGAVGPNTDVTKTVPSLNMAEICNYAQKKGVDIHVWVHWKAIYPNLDKAFSQFQKWGIKGMMVDFLERDDQEMVNIQEEILKKAAEHKLFIQFHGAYKSTGLHRTYPNEFTREGALNYENNKWFTEGLSPNHDLDVAFTRLLAGATDYHLGGFRATPSKKFKTQYTRPLMIGTRSHMLGMYVVLESYLQMVADYPAAYEGQAGFEFLQKVPTTWDETVVPNAEVGKYITVARRKNTDWYVGTINSTEARTVNMALDFLPEGTYTLDWYTDAPDVDEHPDHLIKQTKTVSHKDVLTLELASGGGQVMHLKKQQ
ncbi:glycoside hydrolase family 97 protein [Niabella sp. CJ426]|uniref:glycoside hydrolase family 97 protein n=1 Tax=Niabella sp. CJ426 TaxID=3393740 RepID=UPI003D0569C3